MNEGDRAACDDIMNTKTIETNDSLNMRVRS